MKRILLLCLAIFQVLGLLSQIAPDKYYIQFTDKNNSPYSVNNPEEFLSERAIERRGRFGIPITKQDLPVNPDYIQGVLNTGAVVLNPTKWLNGVTIFVSDSMILQDIGLLPYVKEVFKVGPVGENKNTEKSFFAKEIYLGSDAARTEVIEKASSVIDYGLSYAQINQINGIPLHEEGYLGQGLVIAVLDAGWMGTDTHPVFDSLRANNQILGTKDFVSHSGTVYDFHTHGTSVLSLMGGYFEGQLVGTAPKADYYLLRTEDASSEYIIEEYNWVSGAEYADSAGADIINSSLGYYTFDDPLQNHSFNNMNGNTTPVTIGADIAATKGIIVVNSAGNEGNSSWFHIIAPADGDSVMSVGAVNQLGQIAGFSSHGPTADGRIKPDVVAQGDPAYVAVNGGYFTFGSGTSFSSPIIAGMSACLWQAHPGCTNTDIIKSLKQNASYFENPDNDYGYGIPDFNIANVWLSQPQTSGGDPPLILFPNPVNDHFYILLGDVDGDIIQGVIADRTGRIVLYKDFSLFKGFTLNGVFEFNNLDFLIPGIYFVNILTEKKSYNLKFIK